MAKAFEYFVVFAEMRTGSNFLESNLNEIDGLTCYGEAFNPHFIGYPNRGDICGVTQKMREADPGKLIQAMRQKTKGLPGFRFFHDHDPRILNQVMDDPACAKIILTRNPIESFVSWKIAAETGQWKLTDMKHKKSAKIRFDTEEFDKHLGALQNFQRALLRSLQTSGQTAFYIGYEDIRDVDVLNGLAEFLGIDGRITEISSTLKKQNPSALKDKVVNFDQMEASLARIDLFDLNRTPNFEPQRHAVVPSYLAGKSVPLIFMPVASGPEDAVKAWLGALDSDGLLTDFNQKTLRQWKRKNPGHRSFTVLRHPAERAHAAFCEKILVTGPGTFSDIRKTLRNTYKLPLPKGGDLEGYDAAAHRKAFLAFLKFVEGNLSGQTGIRVDPAWASQAEVLRGLGKFTFPDHVIREAEIDAGLQNLAEEVGLTAPAYTPVQPGNPVALPAIYDGEVEAAVRSAYQRDYVMFGFEAWQPA